MASSFKPKRFSHNLALKIPAYGLFLLGLAAWPALADSRTETIDEITVTGSFIKQSPEDAPVPIDVINSEDLFNIGSPSIVELVRTLGVNSGADGETNQFQSNDLEGTANINLRGLGPGRNLVLLNGRRNVFAPYHIASQAQLFVDINNIPAIALDRVELLKDGAAATYGSDAISGVVNFITRDDFEGTEFTLSHKDIKGSQGDQDFGLIWGRGNGATHIMASVGYHQRHQLRVRDRDWAVSPFFDKGIIRGYSLSPNPGGFLDHNRYLAGPDGDPATSADNPSAIGIPASALAGANSAQDPYGYGDPFCAQHAGTQNFEALAALAGGAFTNRCTYNYTYFDNLIEDEQRHNFFGVVTHDFDDATLKVELLYAKSKVPEWYTSPSFPPQVNFDTRTDTGRYIYADHPGLISFAALDLNGDAAGLDNPFADYADASCDPSTDADNCRRLLFYGRPYGVSGPATIGSRDYETAKLSFSLDGTMDNWFGFSDISYTTSLLLSQSEGKARSQDVLAERWSATLQGYGICGRGNGNVAGAGDCEYYNPFSNAIRVSDQKDAVYTAANPNPNYDADNANSDALRRWLLNDFGTIAENKLLVWDGVISGELNNGIAWAAGAQYRDEERSIAPFELSNLDRNPCQSEAENSEFRNSGRRYNPDGKNCAGGDGVFGGANADDDYTGSGPFYFRGGTNQFDGAQDIMALFGEVQIAPVQDLEVQLSARYEDYGGKVGDSFDPKLAVRYQANDNLAFRASASTTFRGPTLNQLGGRTTTLSLVAAAGNIYKAIDTFGQDDLAPETADTLNFGVLYDADSLIRADDTLAFSLDYWSFSFSDPVVVESYNDLVGNAFSGTGGVFDPDAAFADRITCGGSCVGETATSLERVRVNIVNGPDIETDGFDLAVTYGLPVRRGALEASLNLTQVLSYDVGALAPAVAFDALGKVNNKTSLARPIVETKTTLATRYKLQAHMLNFIVNHTSDYVGTYGSNNTAFTTASHETYDLHYNLSLAALGDALAQSALWVSIYNLTDEDPPLTPLDLNYDPYTHNPFGQMVKVGLRHKF